MRWPWRRSESSFAKGSRKQPGYPFDDGKKPAKAAVLGAGNCKGFHTPDRWESAAVYCIGTQRNFRQMTRKGARSRTDCADSHGFHGTLNICYSLCGPIRFFNTPSVMPLLRNSPIPHSKAGGNNQNDAKHKSRFESQQNQPHGRPGRSGASPIPE